MDDSAVEYNLSPKLLFGLTAPNLESLFAAAYKQTGELREFGRPPETRFYLRSADDQVFFYSLNEWVNIEEMSLRALAETIKDSASAAALVVVLPGSPNSIARFLSQDRAGGRDCQIPLAALGGSLREALFEDLGVSVLAGLFSASFEA